MANYDVNALLGIGAEPAKEPDQEPKQPKARKKTQAKPKPKQDEAGKASDRSDKFIVPKRELYSRRVDLLLKPSTYEKLKALADENGVKVNALANAIFEDYLR